MRFFIRSAAFPNRCECRGASSRARIEGHYARNSLHNAAFPRAVRADQPEDLPGTDIEVDTANRPLPAVVLRSARSFATGPRRRHRRPPTISAPPKDAFFHRMTASHGMPGSTKCSGVFVQIELYGIDKLGPLVLSLYLPGREFGYRGYHGHRGRDGALGETVRIDARG